MIAVDNFAQLPASGAAAGMQSQLVELRNVSFACRRREGLFRSLSGEREPYAP